MSSTENEVERKIDREGGRKRKIEGERERGREKAKREGARGKQVSSD